MSTETVRTAAILSAVSRLTSGRIKSAERLHAAPLPQEANAIERGIDEEPAVVRGVTAKQPGDVWHLDLTVVPTGSDFWVPDEDQGQARRESPPHRRRIGNRGIHHASPEAPSELTKNSARYVAAIESRSPLTLPSASDAHQVGPGVAGEPAPPVLNTKPPAKTTNKYLSGAIVLNIILVEGQGHRFTQAGKTTTLTWLERLHRHVYLRRATPLFFFIHEFHELDITPTERTKEDELWQSESRWLKPAMDLLNCRAKFARWGAYLLNKNAMTQRAADGSITVCFTKYQTRGEPGYAVPDYGLACVFEAALKSGKIGAEIAHEFLHLFGAVDEYPDAKAPGASGYFEIPNYNNKEHMADGVSQSPCVMRAKEGAADYGKTSKFPICEWTRGQVGWPFSYPTFRTSEFTPAVTNHNGASYMACVGTGKGERGHLWLYLGGNYYWQNPKIDIPHNGACAPGIASVGDLLYVTYTNKERHVYAAELDKACLEGDPKSIPKLLISAVQSDYTPAICEHSDKLRVAFCHNSAIYFFDYGSIFSQLVVEKSLPYRSEYGVSITSLNGVLYLAYCDKNDTSKGPGHQIRVVRRHEETGKRPTWVKCADIEQQARSTPSLLAHDGRLHLAFESADRSRELHVTYGEQTTVHDIAWMKWTMATGTSLTHPPRLGSHKMGPQGKFDKLVATYLDGKQVRIMDLQNYDFTPRTLPEAPKASTKSP